VSACFPEQAEALERSEFAQRKLDAIVARQAGPKGPKVKREAAMRIQARVRAFSCRKRLKERHAAAMHSMKIFFLLGGPGSGKSTYAKRLCAEFGVLHLSVGKLLVSCRHAYMQIIISSHRQAAHSCGRSARRQEEVLLSLHSRSIV
jgi:MoxR-like ATPase